MGVHKQTIEWHDLIEDPDDLPKSYLGEFHIMLQFDGHEPYLSCRNASYINSVGFVIYGTTWMYDPISKTLQSSTNSFIIEPNKTHNHLRVVAWCEDVKPYIREEIKS